MDVWSDPKLGQQMAHLLTQKLVSKLTGSRTRCAPSLAYGRHRGPARDRSRIAAVVIAFYWQDGQWWIPLTMRPKTLQHHGGQICLPGGQIEANETPNQAALREYEEELGVTAQVTVHCGELSTKYVFGSDNQVHPVVVVTETPLNPWSPDPTEVAEVITLPLRVLLAPEHRVCVTKSKTVRQDGKPVGKLVQAAPAIEHGKHIIWGATALILDELAQLLQP